jgi:transaldolase
MIKSEDASYIARILEDSILRFEDDHDAAEYVQMELVRPILSSFLPLYKEGKGGQGFVSIQGNPYRDSDSSQIIRESLQYRNLGKNIIAKIPVTEAGLKALETLIPEDVPMIATEVMSVSQAICACEMYRRASNLCGRTPPFFITHITGIFDEYLAGRAEGEGIPISNESLQQAGCIVARKQYRMLMDRNYPVIMLGGGARGPHHFTEFVGGHVHITINWKGMADQLEKMNQPVVSRIDTPTPQHIVEELSTNLPDFRKAYAEDQLSIEEFAEFGPVRYFRDSFVKGWDFLSAAIAQRRAKKGKR